MRAGCAPATAVHAARLAGQAIAPSTIPSADRPFVNADVVSSALTISPSTTTHSASRTTTITANAAATAAQAHVNGLLRCLLTQSTSTPDASSTSADREAERSYGNDSPANTPMATQASSTPRRAGTPESRQSAPKESSTSEAGPSRAGGSRVRRQAGHRSWRGGCGHRLVPLVGGAQGACGGRRARPGQLDPEAGTGLARHRVDDGDPPAVQIGHPAGDGQPEAGAAARRVRQGAEPLEDPLAVLPARCPGPGRRPRGRVESPVDRRPAQTRTTPPAGLCRAALSSRLASSWCSRARSAYDAQVGRLDAYVEGHLRAGSRLG